MCFSLIRRILYLSQCHRSPSRPTDRPSSRPSACIKPHALRTGNREPELISSSLFVTSASLGIQISAVGSERLALRRAEGAISPGSDDCEEKVVKKVHITCGIRGPERDYDSAGKKMPSETAAIQSKLATVGLRIWVQGL